MLRRFRSSSTSSEAENLGPEVADFAASDTAKDDRRNFERQQQERRTVEELRAELQLHFSPENAERDGAGKRNKFGTSNGIKPARIALLLVAVVAGGLAAFMATQRSEPVVEPVVQAVEEIVPVAVVARTQVLVAKATIGVGDKLTPELIGWEDWPKDSVRPDFITSEVTPDAMGDLSGSVARSQIFAGDPISEQKLAQAGQSVLSAVLGGGMRAVSVPVTAESASGGFINPDDHVDVVLTRESPLGQVSETVLSNVRVLAINSRLAGANSAASDAELESAGGVAFSSQAIATLELEPTRAKVLVNASAIGELALVLRSFDDAATKESVAQSGANQAIRISSPFWTN